MIPSSILEGIGRTPTLSISIVEDTVSKSTVYAKAEYLNPAGSVKDRVALHIIREAEKEGRLKKGMTIAEATSGNTGISVAMVGLILGYKVVVIMPENMSLERRQLIQSLNAELILTPKEASVEGAVQKLEELRRKDSSIFVPDQFRNKHNIDAHYQTTGPEIWQDMDGDVDVFVSGIGSGGTLTGIGIYLKEKNPNIKIVAVEPFGSSVLLGQEPKLHRIEGIGDGFIPEILDPQIIDTVLEIDDGVAVDMARYLSRRKGLLVGISSGANIKGAFEAAKMFGSDKRIVTILPDRIERYFSTDLFKE